MRNTPKLRCLVPIPFAKEVNGIKLPIEAKQCPSEIRPGHVMCESHWALMDKDLKHLLLGRQIELGRKDRRQDLKWRELVELSARDVFTKLARILAPEKFKGESDAAGGSAENQGSGEASTEATSAHDQDGARVHPEGNG